MHIEAEKPIGRDVVSSNDGIEVGLCLSLCDKSLLGASDDGDCGYYPRDLMCPSAAMRSRVVDEDEAGDGACCSMDFVCPTGDLTGRAECEWEPEGRGKVRDWHDRRTQRGCNRHIRWWHKVPRHRLTGCRQAWLLRVQVVGM